MVFTCCCYCGAEAPKPQPLEHYRGCLTTRPNREMTFEEWEAKDGMQPDWWTIEDPLANPYECFVGWLKDQGSMLVEVTA